MTHTFHLVIREATITLQDVAVLLRMRVHNRAAIDNLSDDWHGVVEDLLGLRPRVDPETQRPYLQGSSLRMT